MRNVLTKAAVAIAVLAGASLSAHAGPYVELRITDISAGANGTFESGDSFVQKTCSTATLASVAACASSGFLVAGVGATTITFGTSLQALSFIDPGFATSGIVGSFTLSSSSAVSNSPGTPGEAILNRSETSALRNTPADGFIHRLIVDFRAFGYTDPDGEWKTISASGGFSGNAFSYQTTDSFSSVFSVDKNDGTAATQSISCLGLQPAGPVSGPFSTPCNLAPVLWQDTNAPNSLFSMRSIQQFDMAVGSNVNAIANSSVRNIPEPMTTSLVGMALVGMALAARRKAAVKV